MARSNDQPEKYGVAQAPGFARKTAINLLGRLNRALNELTDGTVCSVDAVTGAEIGPYRKSRIIGAVPVRALKDGRPYSCGARDDRAVSMMDDDASPRRLGRGGPRSSDARVPEKPLLQSATLLAD